MLPFDDEPAPKRDEAAFSANGIAHAASIFSLMVLAILHTRRAFECRHITQAVSGSGLWDWMCASDPFASYSFLPIHVLALVTVCAWLLLTLRGGALHALGATHTSSASLAVAPRMLEVYLAVWSLCWFSPAHPFAATADCHNLDPTCEQWAASGECERNKDFMLKTCRLACHECVADGSASVGWAALGPRTVTLSGGGALLLLASCRLVLASLSPESRRRVIRSIQLLLRPLSILAGLIMRTPFGPLVRLLLLLLRRAFGSVLSLLRLIIAVFQGCGNVCRRNLIVALGGKVGDLEKAFTD